MKGQRLRRRLTLEMNLSGMAAGGDGSGAEWSLVAARHDQAVADVELLARQQAAEASPPRPAVHIVAQAVERAPQHVLVEVREARYPGPRGGFEVALRAAPERAEEAVAAVARDRHALDRRLAAERLDRRGDRREAGAVERGDLGQVVAHQPERLRLA